MKYVKCYTLYVIKKLGIYTVSSIIKNKGTVMYLHIKMQFIPVYDFSHPQM